MSKISMFVFDGHLSLQGALSTELVGAMIGALGADAATWGEWRYAMERFLNGADQPKYLGLQPVSITDDVPAKSIDRMDAGAECIIDLSAEMLLTAWNQSVDPLPAHWFDDDGATGLVLPYHIGADWLISSDFSLWQQHSNERRLRLAQRSRIKLRTVLYGREALSFMLEWCQSRMADGNALHAREYPSHDSRARRVVEPSDVCAALRLWLAQTPENLQGQSVEAAMLWDHDHIARDMADREMQWLRTGAPAIGLRESDTAYRQSGLGPHEVTLYCKLLEHLLYAYSERLDQHELEVGTFEDQLQWLCSRRDEWLWKACETELMQRAPSDIINLERRRIPLVVEASDPIEHDDCPLCQLMRCDDNGPVFRRLSGVFVNQQSLVGLEEVMDPHNGSPTVLGSHDAADTMGCAEAWRPPGGRVCERRFDESVRFKLPNDPIWKRVSILSEPGEISPDIELFTVGACTGELIEDLKERTADHHWIESLNRCVINLNAALHETDPALLESVIAMFCECLDDVQGKYGTLSDKSDDLQTRLVGLMQRFEQSTEE